ncbi:MAG: Calx-beta domain-containing protein [Nocardioidaceae bacterium]
MAPFGSENENRGQQARRTLRQIGGGSRMAAWATDLSRCVLVVTTATALAVVPTGLDPSGAASVPDDGVVVAWGSNDYGQTTVPAAAQGETTQVAAGAFHSLALRSDGSVVAWGRNDEGQATVPAAGSSGITQVTAGSFRSFALKGDGVIAWGLDPNVPVDAQSGVTQIAAGAFHTLALKSDGSVVAWGNNVYGQSTVPVAARTGVIQVTARGYHSLALKSDGSVVAWGDDAYGQSTVPVAAQSGVIEVAAGAYHSLALKSDGSVVAWGQNFYGQSTVPAAALDRVVQVAADNHCLAMKNDGSVVAWGLDDDGQATVPPGLGGVTDVATGSFHSLAVTASPATLAFGLTTTKVGEDAGIVHVPVTRAGRTSNVASAHYARMSGTATPGADFTLDEGTITFSPGQTSSTIPVAIGNDSVPEGTENIVVSLSSPAAGTVLATPSSTTLVINVSDQQPDALVSTSAATGFVGDDIYNTTGAGQTKTTSAPRTTLTTFYVRIVNDGTTPDTFQVTGSGSPSGAKVAYYSGTTDITTKMRSAAGYDVALPVGAKKVLRVTVRITRGAVFGTTKTATVRAAWTGDGTNRDAVRAKVRVVR